MPVNDLLKYRINSTRYILYIGAALYFFYSIVFNYFIGFNLGYFPYFFILTLYCVIAGSNLHKLKCERINCYNILDISLMTAFSLASFIPLMVLTRVGWKSEYRALLFMILMSNLESSFLSYKRNIIIQYCITSAMGIYVIMQTDYSISNKIGIMLVLVLLLVWKLVIGDFHSFIVKNREIEIQAQTHKKVIQNIRHDINNTNTIIYGVLNSIKKRDLQSADLIKLEKGILRLSSDLKNLDEIPKEIFIFNSKEAVFRLKKP